MAIIEVRTSFTRRSQKAKKICYTLAMKKIILFDFDGVILDSFSPAYEASKMIHPRMTEDEYREAFEGNINNPHSHTHECGDDCRKDIDFFEKYIPLMKKRTKIFDGMENVIKKLSENYILCIVSSTITLPIRKLLKKSTLEKYFNEILGNDVHKSKVEKIKMIMHKYKINKDDCIFVTDTLGDMKEARAVNIKSIGVSWGFHKIETLKKGSPEKIVNSPKELELAISEILPKQ
ncbi:MAG TPA: HAD family hydrolase [Candidatus Paceibacterota bacterium]|nr:HAD family hydrolase [Candidatus Paceibacterota bacterium]HRZ34469.1 HAD family hydrolase [Candidatus Paceibacterota bacterium]